MRILVLLATLVLLAGCVTGGPTRVSNIPESCPSWVEGPSKPSVSTSFSPRFPEDWQTVDFSDEKQTANGTVPAVPLTGGTHLESSPSGKVLSQDRIQLDFNWEAKPDGTWTKRGIEVFGAELTVRFTHGAGAPGEGRDLPFYIIGLPEGLDGNRHLKVFDSFTFQPGFTANFTLHVLLDQLDGSPDPAGAFAIWDYVPQSGQDLATLPSSVYVYRAAGLYDRCEFN